MATIRNYISEDRHRHRDKCSCDCENNEILAGEVRLTNLRRASRNNACSSPYPGLCGIFSNNYYASCSEPYRDFCNRSARRNCDNGRSGCANNPYGYWNSPYYGELEGECAWL